MIHAPQLSPYFIKIGSFGLRWYGLAYLAGIVIGLWAIRPLLRPRFACTFSQLQDLMAFLLVGILLGGRIGYIVFYDLSYYLSTPLEIFKLWNGGMSFHGGALGCLVSCYFFARSVSLPFWILVDAISAVAPIGLFLGRLANFVNGELYGRATTVAWGMIFPDGGPIVRHPSQLYEAFFEGIVLFGILYPLSRKRILPSGSLTGLFMVLYGIFRFAIEFFREPDSQIGLFWSFFSEGQLLCLLMSIAGGCLLLLRTFRKGPT